MSVREGNDQVSGFKKLTDIPLARRVSSTSAMYAAHHCLVRRDCSALPRAAYAIEVAALSYEILPSLPATRRRDRLGKAMKPSVTTAELEEFDGAPGSHMGNSAAPNSPIDQG